MTKQITLRLPDEVHARLKVVAGRNHRSAHAQALTYVERGLEQEPEDQEDAS